MVTSLLSHEETLRLTSAGLSQYRYLLILPSPVVQELDRLGESAGAGPGAEEAV